MLYLLIEILAEFSVNVGNASGIGPRQYSERNVDHLEILGSRRTRDLPRSGSDVVNGRILEPRHAEMQTLGHDVVLDASDTVKHDGAVTIHCKVSH